MEIYRKGKSLRSQLQGYANEDGARVSDTNLRIPSTEDDI